MTSENAAHLKDVFGLTTYPITSDPGGSTSRSSSSSHQLGAAPPGRRATDLSQQNSPFSQIDYRRGKFPSQIPATKENWDAAKWKNMMDLKPFAPATEIELEQWFANSAKKIKAHSATARVVLRVMELTCTTEFEYAINSVTPYADALVYIEDMADAIARRMFVGYRELEEFEHRIQLQEPRQSVYAAYASHRNIHETYLYMCSRRSRSSVLGRPQLVDLAMSLMPARVTEAIRHARPEKE